jgi:hypothetical protein
MRLNRRNFLKLSASAGEERVAGVVAYDLATGELLNTIFAWFAVLDVIFLALFVVFLMTVRQQVLPGVPTSPPGRPVESD